MIDQTSCKLCGSHDIKFFFDIGEVPLGFPVPPDTGKVWAQPLSLNICLNCLLVCTQNTIPEDNLVHENLYQSGYSIISQHDDGFVPWAEKHIPISKDDLIVEIGCGDGSLLKRFGRAGYNWLLGIDPSLHENKTYQFEVIEDFFCGEVVDYLIESDKAPKFMFANYVIEHIPDLDCFIADTSRLMIDRSYVAVEVPYFNDFFYGKRIDGFGHLECNWFTKNSLVSLFTKGELNVVSIEHDQDYRGGTLKAIFVKGTETLMPHHVQEELDKEKEAFALGKLSSNANKIEALRDHVRAELKKYTASNRLFLYGAGHKATTLLHWLGLNNTDIHYAVDQDIHKQGCVVPNLEIPIKDVAVLLADANEGPVSVLNMAIDHCEEVEKFLEPV